MLLRITQEFPRCCEGFVKSKLIDEEGNITQQTEIIFKHMKEFEYKSHLLIARSLDMIDDVVCVRFLTPYIRTEENLQKCENRMCGKP